MTAAGINASMEAAREERVTGGGTDPYVGGWGSPPPETWERIHMRIRIAIPCVSMVIHTAKALHVYL